MKSYLGISVFNKSISPGSGEVGVITDKFFIQKDKDFAFSWKHINYSSSSILDAIYIIKEDGTKIKLPNINLNDFSVINIFEGKEEHLCYIKYRSNFSGTIGIQIGRKQIQADREDVKVFDARHLLFERGININTWRPKLESHEKTLSKLKTQILQLSEKLSFSASKEDFNNLDQKISKALSKIDIHADKIENTVRVDNLTSYLRQDVESFMIGFNGISDSVTITRKGIRVWHEGKGYTHMGHEEIYQTDNTAGRKLIALKDGGYRIYKNDTDNSYVGGIISGAKMLNGGTKGFGMTIANGYKSWYTSIGYNPKVYNPSDESITGYQSFLDVVFTQHYNEDGTFMRVGTHILNGGLDLHHHNVFNMGIIWFDPSDYDAIHKDSEGMTVQCENIIKLIRNSSKGEHREALRCDFPSNEIKFNMNLNGQGYTMYNTQWQGTYVQPTALFSIFARVAPTSLLDNIDVVNTQNGKLGLAKIPSPFLCLKSSLDNIETPTTKETFEYEQIIFSLVKEVKELKKEIKQMKEGV